MKDIADALHHLAAASDTSVEHDDVALDASFAASAERVKAAKPSMAQKLMLYGLYKQAERGDAPTSRPSLLDRVACAKHDAWAAFKGVTPCRAKTTYIAAVDSLLPQPKPPSKSRTVLPTPPVPPPPEVTAARSNATGFDDRAAAVPLQLEADGTAVHFTPKHTWSLKNNPLCGILLLPYLRILLPRWRDVDMVYYPRALFLAVLATVNTLLAAVEHLLYGDAVHAQPLPADPVFIVGHPRTGTTLLHNLLAADGAHFFAATTFCVGFPSCFLWFEGLGKVRPLPLFVLLPLPTAFVCRFVFARVCAWQDLLAGVIDRTRPMDSMPLHFDLPQVGFLGRQAQMRSSLSPTRATGYLSSLPRSRCCRSPNSLSPGRGRRMRSP